MASDYSTTLRAWTNTNAGCTWSCVHLMEVKNLAVAASTTPTFGLSNTRYPPATRTLPGADTVVVAPELVVLAYIGR